MSLQYAGMGETIGWTVVTLGAGRRAAFRRAAAVPALLHLERPGPQSRKRAVLGLSRVSMDLHGRRTGAFRRAAIQNLYQTKRHSAHPRERDRGNARWRILDRHRRGCGPLSSAAAGPAVRRLRTGRRSGSAIREHAGGRPRWISAGGHKPWIVPDRASDPGSH